jgi:hypothetical protein
MQNGEGIYKQSKPTTVLVSCLQTDAIDKKADYRFLKVRLPQNIYEEIHASDVLQSNRYKFIVPGGRDACVRRIPEDIMSTCLLGPRVSSWTVS